MFYQLIKYQKVQLYLQLKLNGVTEVHSLKPQELIVPLLDIPKMELKLELDYHQEPEKPFLENAEPQLVLLPEEEEPINQSSKQGTYSININVRERCGQLLEVLP